ncbi:hypothetical protein GKZ68_11355 [Hymenobacter sp. BRD128]|uniref:hypothetical protein n=1 Tax=Hymenobacter sp. BRD128 TaxID=2675878 RepID=UPI0015662DFF|nr:hypothetical protein [Hymenobacter sp. BRD128]QKG57172.1 hypothetical protein GKZ68_11355 [Hymenobacter sp. BRD128]
MNTLLLTSQRPRCLFSILLGLAAECGLAGCNLRPCNPADPGPQPFGIAFSTDTLGAGKGFRKAEAFSAYLVRYRGADFSQPLDTLRANDRPKSPMLFYYVDRTLFCNFPAVGGPSDPRSYRLEVPAAKRRYDISDIVLTYGGVDNCTRTITRFDALINGQRVDTRQGYVATK